MERPTVVCLRRRRDGTILQDCTVYIGRAWHMGGWHLQKSKWANPYSVKQYGRETALKRYEQHIRNSPELLAALSELSGQQLGCFCVGKVKRMTEDEEVCHGEILVRLWDECVAQ